MIKEEKLDSKKVEIGKRIEFIIKNEELYYTDLDKRTPENRYSYLERKIRITREVLKRHTDLPIKLFDFLVKCVQEETVMEYETIKFDIYTVNNLEKLYNEGIDTIRNNKEYQFYKSQISLFRELLPRYGIQSTITESIIECVQNKTAIEYLASNNKNTYKIFKRNELKN